MRETWVLDIIIKLLLHYTNVGVLVFKQYNEGAAE